MVNGKIDYFTCPCCKGENMEYGDTDVRQSPSGKHEWFQYITCKACKVTFRAVFHLAYKEIVK